MISALDSGANQSFHLLTMSILLTRYQDVRQGCEGLTTKPKVLERSLSVLGHGKSQCSFHWMGT